MAPAPRSYFAHRVYRWPQFATNILARPRRVAIIVDDVGYFNEGTFSDGIIAQAVNTVSRRVCCISRGRQLGPIWTAALPELGGDFVNSGVSIPVINTGEGQTVLVNAFDGTHYYDAVNLRAPLGCSGQPCPTNLNVRSTWRFVQRLRFFVMDSTLSTVKDSRRTSDLHSRSLRTNFYRTGKPAIVS